MAVGNAVFTRLCSRPIPRVTRMMDEAREMGYGTIFLAARRENSLPDTDVYMGHDVRRIGPFFPLLNGRRALFYVKSVMLYNFSLYRALRGLRPALVHCSDIETMPASILYKIFYRPRLIYNIHDNLAQRYSFPSLVQVFLNHLEGFAVLLSSHALVPESFRRSSLPRWCRSKVSVVRNTPTDRGACSPPSNTIPIRLFFGGWLDSGRGLRQLLELVRNNEDLELTVAGEGDPELVSEIESAPRTRYLGFVTHDRIMIETCRAHVVAALYDPARPINRYAASNKLAEALSCGRPVLVNSEMLITQALSGYDCLIELPYRDIIERAAVLVRSVVSRDVVTYRAQCARARTAYNEHYSWSDAKAAMQKAIEG